MYRIAIAGLVPAVLFSPVLASAAPSRAAPVSPLQRIDTAKLPAGCRTLARVPASARTSDPDFAAHLSVASCMAETAMAGIALSPDDAGIAALNAAAAPSVTILDDVIAQGDPRWKLIAEESLGDLDVGMMVRLRTVGSSDANARAQLEPKLTPWRDHAEQAFREVAAIAAAHTDLVNKDAVVASAIREAHAG